jgi:tRNA pseudouridine(55) synthase
MVIVSDNMKEIITLHKRKGETPLQALERLREERLEYKDAVLSYAGRLDPLASGILLVLVGDMNKERERFLSLDKEYVCEILWGFRTDTFDVLGKVTDQRDAPSDIEKSLASVSGELLLPYPQYSSKTVNGKALFSYAREGLLSEIEIPTRKMAVQDASLMETRDISSSDILKTIIKKVSQVDGDFRQEEIIKIWQENLSHEGAHIISKVRFSVSSGTYIRALVEKMGGVILSLERVRVGDFENSVY